MKKLVAFRIEEKLLKEFKKRLEKRGAKLTSVVVNMIKDYMKK